MGTFLRDVFKLNEENRNFRIVGPDETASNRLDAAFEATGKTWLAALHPNDEILASDGRVMEVLSEHLCQGWLEVICTGSSSATRPSYTSSTQCSTSMLSGLRWRAMCRGGVQSPR